MYTKEKEELIIVGIGPSAQQAYDFIKIHNLYDIIGFTVDAQYVVESEFNGKPVYDIETLEQKINMKRVKVFVSLGWNRLNSDRRILYERLKKRNYQFANLISPLAIIRGTIDGDNIWINDYSVIQSGAVIHSDVTIREHVVIGNETTICEHVFIGIKGLVAGGCYIGEQSFIGINATVFDQTTVGTKCIIGGSTVIKRNVPDFSVCKTKTDQYSFITYDEDTIEQKLISSFNVR